MLSAILLSAYRTLDQTNRMFVLDPAGGQWQELTRMEEPNMASAQVIKDFLQEGFRQ